jgi:hypothetical protein
MLWLLNSNRRGERRKQSLLNVILPCDMLRLLKRLNNSKGKGGKFLSLNVM